MDVLQPGNAADVDQMAGGPQPELEQRQEALPERTLASSPCSLSSAKASSRVCGA
jgi:hypothetical protein